MVNGFNTSNRFNTPEGSKSSIICKNWKIITAEAQSRVLIAHRDNCLFTVVYANKLEQDSNE